MYIYFAFFILLVVSSIIEYFHESTNKKLFYFLFAIFALMLCLRYGQGTDYISYNQTFNIVPPTLNPITLKHLSLPQEIGWLELNGLFKLLRFPFEGLVFFVSLIEIFFLLRFFNHFCKYKILALTLSYPTLYLTYMFSALRQGLVTCVFLGLLLDFYLNKKYLKYVIACLILATIHSSALVLLVILIFKTDIINECGTLNFKYIAIIGGSWIIGIMMYFAGHFVAFSSIPFIPGRIAIYLGNTSFSIASIGERIISYIFVVILISNKTELTKDIRKVFYVYTLGFIMYGLIFWNPLIASRTCFALKAVEIILISNLLYYNNSYKLNKAVRFVVIIVLTSTMYFKNINSYIEQGSYDSNVNMINYPYVSLIKKDISSYRNYSLD